MRDRFQADRRRSLTGRLISIKTVHTKREQAFACSLVLSTGLSERDLHEFLLALLQNELAVLEVSLCN